MDHYDKFSFLIEELSNMRDKQLSSNKHVTDSSHVCAIFQQKKKYV